MRDDSSPMKYYHVLSTLREILPRDVIIASERANTMDIGRTILNNYEPRTRLDAGTFGTMGVGLGFAIAAAVTNPGRRVVDVEGDSAFGFSGMEVETACRYKLPITFVVVNNNGIGGGPTEFDPDKPIPPNAYTPQAHYEKMMDSFGGKGYFVTESSELKPALQEALSADGPTLVNIMISNRATRKPQQFRWLTT